MKRMKATLLTLVVAASLATPGVAVATPQSDAAATVSVSCTKTSTGKCIRRGQFCPRAKYNRYGWLSSGARVKCKRVGGRYRWA